MTTPPTPNADAIEAWNTVLFDKFTRFRGLCSDALAVHGDRAIELLPFSPGLRVLDIGCGFGDTTREIGKRVGSRGLAVGVDAAPRFIDVARREAAGIEQVRFRVGDVQTAPLEGPFDVAFSRMGTMFFAQPVVALRNIARSLVPDGLLSMVVWRRRDANPAFVIAEQVVMKYLPPEPQIEAVTCGPGPFSMSDPDVVSEQLVAAGFTDVAFRRHDADLKVGDTVEHAIEFALALGPAGEKMRLGGEVAERHRPAIVEALREAFAQFATANAVRIGTSTWLVTARRAAATATTRVGPAQARIL